MKNIINKEKGFIKEIIIIIIVIFILAYFNISPNAIWGKIVDTFNAILNFFK